MPSSPLPTVSQLSSRRSAMAVRCLYCFCLVMLVSSTSAVLAQQDEEFPAAVYPEASTEESTDIDTAANEQKIDAYTRSLNELFVTSQAISDQPGGDEPVVFDGEFNDPRWLQGLTVTKSDNPMLEEACRKQAVEAVSTQAAALMHIEDDEVALQAMLEHMEEHASFIREHDISHADYLRSLAECETYCAPLVAALMQCHILSVARKPHGIVMFDIGSSRVDPAYNTGVIAEIINAYKNQPDARILLVGRASQIGDLRYNRRLSGERSLAVRDELLAAGIPMERIRPIWFGWEPPQIDEFMATEYGIADLYFSNGKADMNQSVVLVLF